MSFLTGKKAWDLTLPFDGYIRGFSHDPAKVLEQDGWNASTYTLYSHSGTHMDAPLHFGVSQESIDQIPLTQFFSEAWLLRKPQTPPRYVFQVEDLGPLKEKVQPGESLLIQSGWSRRLQDTSYRDELPRIGEDLANWMAEKQLTVLGVEPPSVADVNNLREVTRIHHILLGAGIRIIEGLCNLELLEGDKVGLVALPLKVSRGDGAPTRVIAYQI